MREQQWHCQSHLRGSCGGGGTEIATFVEDLIDVICGRGGGEMGNFGVNGVGGMVRWDERKGVGVMAKVGIFCWSSVAVMLRYCRVAGVKRDESRFRLQCVCKLLAFHL